MSFLDRLIRLADPHSSERSTWKAGDIESDVVAHVVQIVNTRQGSALTCVDYGLVEVSDVTHDFPDAVGIIQRSLKNCIQTYEPRLKNVQVRPLKTDGPAELSLSFEITAQLTTPDGRKQALRMTTTVDGSGNVKAGY